MDNLLPPDDDLDWNALARFFAGEAPEEEEMALRHWIELDPARAELVERLRDVWEHAGSTGQYWDPEAALRQIRQKAVRPASPDALPFRATQPARRADRLTARHRQRSGNAGLAGDADTRRRVVSPRRWAGRHAWRAAAAIVVASAATMWWFTTRDQPLAEVAMLERVTGTAERATLRFGDGTVIVLAPESRLRHPEEYDGRPAEVHLTGAAYFEVPHDAKRPFRVLTEHGVAEDLGTRFNVRAYRDAEATEVAVAEGKVALGARTAAERGRAPGTGGSAPVVLDVGDLGTLDRAGAVAVRHDFDVSSRMAWTAGRLVFVDTPLRDVAAELARWYDLEIHVPDSALAAQPVTASFDHEPLAQVLVVVAAAADARYDRDGSVVTLSPNHSAR